MPTLPQAIEHAAHLLPSQGPITSFVHHNTLHAFEELPFHAALEAGSATYGSQPYLAEDQYRRELARGRILPQDLSAILIEDLGDDADALIGCLGTRYQLRLAMLQHPLRSGTDAEMRWFIAETSALWRFKDEVRPELQARAVGKTQHWVMRDLRGNGVAADPRLERLAAGLFEQFQADRIEHWNPEKWAGFTLHLLWRVCRSGVHGLAANPRHDVRRARHRDLLLAAGGPDIDPWVNKILIRFCGCFLDQGFAAWTLPHRNEGFWRAFAELYRQSSPIRGWMRNLPAELRRIEAAGLSPLESLAESLALLGVPEHETEEFVAQTLLALGGWAGMLWQMETNAEWTVHPAPAGSLCEYLAVRLLLERLALAHGMAELGLTGIELAELRARLRSKVHHGQRASVDRRAFAVFQLAQFRGWSPAELWRLSKAEWATLVHEIEEFSGVQRRRVYHLAFERHYRNQALDAVAAHVRRAPAPPVEPIFQFITCIDEREESFRRHLEEVEPACETFAAAGFFGVAMYYQGAADANFVPLCPVIVKPRHYVVEEVVYSLQDSHRRRAETRRVLGRASHRFHTESRTFFGGLLAAVVGPLASFPLVTRVLFPRLTSRLAQSFGRFVQPPPITRLDLERTADPPGPEPGHRGYSVPEMAEIVARILRDLGLTARFSRLVIVAGHGSSSLNNPHESAYNCGACSGGRGGPNARAFAHMANDSRVRALVRQAGIEIPATTHFLGAFHNTCDDSLAFHDLDRLPLSHQEDFRKASAALDEARGRNAHERCRRFESADFRLSPAGALRHVETRAEDLSQARPEYNHATNALCLVGRRAWSRGLFLDRRAFLTSYDPRQDDAEQTVLLRILQAAIPVCAGISLEYYFSRVDTDRLGCGSKLPHNITSLLGVMEGAASDLRPGLSQQMVEIHEPLRILFVIETSPAAMASILERHEVIRRLVRNEWVQLAVIDPETPRLHWYRDGQFEPYQVDSVELPLVRRSVDWYRGWRDHLGFASIVPAGDARGAPAPDGTSPPGAPR
ncbi:MAG: DUF2309 domain-containing protein [Planctomycetaceae bacterium]|nr:DUF2309 domain-containing protein [Planctomycetaceae bacterium]